MRVRIGSLQVGIASSCVGQAQARPAGVLPVPGTTGALVGVFSYQGRVIPLIDLRPWLHMAADTPCAYVLVLATDGLLAGLAVDTVSSAQKIHPEH